MCQSGINDHKVLVKSAELLSPDVVSMWIEADTINFMPGQFLMIEVPGTALRRPFVIVDKAGKDIRIVFKIRGKGTKKLSELKQGTPLKALAPLGNSFPDLPKGSRPLLLGGGIGAVTLLPLAKLYSKDCQAAILLGADTEASLVMLNEFSKCSKINTCTDDGSAGEKCNAVALAKKYIQNSSERFTVYACGPTPMLKAAAKLCKEVGLPCFVSLEERMGCGVGACVCCVVKTKEGLKRVCKDGPVFNAEDIIWEA